ncbi:hypothetical protein BH11MYX2_BH11MYX2_32100 [soil metagenome]
MHTALFPRAPAIEGWKVVAFKQPAGPGGVRFGGLDCSVDDVFFVEGLPGDIDLCLEAFDTNRDAVGPIAFILLDGMLGEFGVMTKIGKLQFFDMANLPANARPLRELPAALGN